MSSFDAKINNENMTKCLQSLKEMYQDLATRQTYCAQEAEFRQYSVLVKLNDGDILRSVHKEGHNFFFSFKKWPSGVFNCAENHKFDPPFYYYYFFLPPLPGRCSSSEMRCAIPPR